jgi:hypothetical protein
MGNPGAMNADDPLDNVVLFDVPFQIDALCEVLQADRLAWLHFRDGRQYVAAALRGHPDDLATLLRCAEDWAVRHCLGQLRFEVDGRAYALVTGSPMFATR